MGFQGRCNKPEDTCYSFWVGGALTLLGAYEFIDFPLIRAFTLSCQKPQGGFAKWPDQRQDVLHSYFGLAGLSLGGEAGLQPLDAALGLSRYSFVSNASRASGSWYKAPTKLT